MQQKTIFYKVDEKVITKVDSAEIKNSLSEKLLGVTIDSQLSFANIFAMYVVKQRLDLV